MAELLEDITWYRGDSYPLILTLKDKTTKLPLNLTGYQVEFTVSLIKDTVLTEHQLFKIIGVVDADQEVNTGKVELVILTEHTSSLSFGAYYYDIQIKYGLSNVRTIKKAYFKVTQDINKN